MIHFARLVPFALLAGLLPTIVNAQVEEAKFSAANIENAEYSVGDLTPGRSALTAKVQILLDRSGTSPGVIDGFKGGMSESAIMAFERQAKLPVDGILDRAVWDRLRPYAAQPVVMDYTITAEDMQGIVDAIPNDYAEKAKMQALGFTSIAEKLGERFHMDEKFIAYLNPGIELKEGATIQVVSPVTPVKGKAARILIDKKTRRVAVYDAVGDMLADYPATIGSDQTPSPSGDHKVTRIALNPNYTYNPKVNFKQGDNDQVLTIPPGPNGPVGTVWIALSKPTYGIHGTPTPSQLFRNLSRGCVRLTNWDAWELAHLVQPGVTKVQFLPDGISIADATGISPVDPASPPTPTQGMAATPAQPTSTAPKVIEDTTEETADLNAPAAGDQDFTVDLLSEALSKVLPDDAATDAPQTTQP